MIENYKDLKEIIEKQAALNQKLEAMVLELDSERAKNAKLCAQQEIEENAPLTLDELREMDGNPVWVEDLASPELACYWLCYWGRGRHFTLMSKHLIGYLLGDYGKTWLAYRRKPEEGAE